MNIEIALIFETSESTITREIQLNLGKRSLPPNTERKTFCMFGFFTVH